MELNEYFAALRNRWYLLVVVALIGGMGGYFYAALQPDQYESQTSAFVSSQRGDTVSELVQGSQYTQGLMQSYAKLALTPTVLRPVIDELNLDMTVQHLTSSLTAEVDLNTVILTVHAVSSDPQKSAKIADAVIDQLSDAVSALSPRDADGNPSVKLTTVTPAAVPQYPFAPNTKLLTITGFLIGLLAAATYAVLKSALDTRIRTESDISRVGDIPFLGSVPRLRRGRRSGTSRAQWDMSAGIREAYRRIATNLDFADIDGSVGMIVVTSALPKEGKTTTSINLAMALAERRHRVLLMDADLRRPRVAESCGIDGTVGLTTVLMHQVSLADAVQSWAGRNIDILASGQRPPNPTEIVSSDAMRRVLDEARKQYDFVVIDSAPLLPVSDTLTLARIVGDTLIVARFNSTRRQVLARTLESLTAVNARVVGTVINAAPRALRKSSYYAETDLLPAQATPIQTAPNPRDDARLRRSRVNTDAIDSTEAQPVDKSLAQIMRQLTPTNTSED